MGKHKNHLSKAYGLDNLDSTQEFYSDWAATYDIEVGEAGYITPKRCAVALAEFAPSKDIAILDIGCGTGLSGQALKDAGFTNLTGSDINPDMLELAQTKGIYQHLELADPEKTPQLDRFQAVTAIGVIGSGAAPLAVLESYVDHLPADALIVFSFNDHTLNNPNFQARVRKYIDDGILVEKSKAYGPHLPGEGMNSMVYCLQRTAT